MEALTWNIQIARKDGSTIVPEITNARYDWDTQRPVVAGGSFDTTEDLGNLIGARLLLTINGTDISWFAVTASSPTYTPSGVEWSVEFMDDTSRLEKQRLVHPVGLSANTPVASTIRTRLAASDLRASVDDNDETLRTAKAWSAGSTTELQVVNDLFNAIGFHGLWPSPFGLFSERHIDPATATIAHTFKEGEESLHIHDYAVDSDYMAIPNRLMVTSPGDSQKPALSAVAQDVNSSPWSFTARGFWVDAEPVTSDYTTQAGLVADAERRLRALQSAAVTMRLQHVWTPDVTPGSVVEIVSDNLDIAGRWQVTSSSISSGVGSLATSSIRKV